MRAPIDLAAKRLHGGVQRRDLVRQSGDYRRDLAELLAARSLPFNPLVSPARLVVLKDTNLFALRLNFQSQGNHLLPQVRGRCFVLRWIDGLSVWVCLWHCLDMSETFMLIRGLRPLWLAVFLAVALPASAGFALAQSGPDGGAEGQGGSGSPQSEPTPRTSGGGGFGSAEAEVEESPEVDQAPLELAPEMQAASTGIGDPDAPEDLLQNATDKVSIAGTSGNGGHLSYSVPIEVSAFRGVEPSVSLQYNSSRKTKLGGLYQGWLGYAWGEGIDVIERASPLRPVVLRRHRHLFAQWRGTGGLCDKHRIADLQHWRHACHQERIVLAHQLLHREQRMIATLANTDNVPLTSVQLVDELDRVSFSYTSRLDVGQPVGLVPGKHAAAVSGHVAVGVIADGSGAQMRRGMRAMPLRAG